MDHTAAFAGFAPDRRLVPAAALRRPARHQRVPDRGGQRAGPRSPSHPGRRADQRRPPAGLKHKRRKPTILVRATASDVSDVQITVVRRRKGKGGKRKRSSTAVDGLVGYDGARVQLPVRKLKRNFRYRIIADARLGTADISTTMKVKKKRKRK